MLEAGKVQKVTIYVSEGATYHGVSTYSAILDFLYFRGVSGATAVKGIGGFGADRHLHSASFLEISDRLPLKIEFIETPEKVEELLGKLEEMAGSGMIEVQETRIVKAAAPSMRKEPQPLPSLRIEGKAKMMRVYVGEDDRWNGQPLHKVLIEAMRANDLAGATVYRGILGYGAHRRVHHEKPLHLSRDCSMMISVVDTEEKIQAFLPVLERMVEEGLIVLSDVDVIKYSHRPIAPEAAEEKA